MKHVTHHIKRSTKPLKVRSRKHSRFQQEISNRVAILSITFTLISIIGAYLYISGIFQDNLVPTTANALSSMGPSGATGSSGASPSATIKPTILPTVAPSTTPIPESNLLQNGGFEIDANADGKPDSWGGAPYFSRTNAVVHSGGFAGMYSSTTNLNYGVVQVVNGIIPNKVYKFSSWVNIPVTMKNFRYAIKFHWLNAKGNTSATKTIDTANKATNGWIQIGDDTVKAPANAVSVIVDMDLNNLIGTIYVDDFMFK